MVYQAGNREEVPWGGTHRAELITATGDSADLHHGRNVVS